MKKTVISPVISLITAFAIVLSFIPLGVFAQDILVVTDTRTRTANPPAPPSGALEDATEVVFRNGEEMDTFINPVSISYQFQEMYNSRESADPAVALFTDKHGDQLYWLFASHGSGYWWSDDLAEWNYVYVMDNSKLIVREGRHEFTRFAPATMVIDDYLYITHSEGGAILKSNDPKDPNSWEYVRPHYNGWGDPALFYDKELDRTFCYYGTSLTEPLYVIELDHKQPDMPLIAGPIPLYNSNREAHGYEVNGDWNDQFGNRPFLEGAWVTKYNGKYYLEFGVPGTQFGSYADGVAVADDPLGPFRHSDHSPVSYKGTGFVRGAGHGCTFEDKYGNWWKVDTVSISSTTGFERRLILFPATHSDQDELISNTMFADYPMYKHDLTDMTFEQKGPDWHLVSYNPKEVTASSTLTMDKKTYYPASANRGTDNKDPQSNSPESAFDENMKTWWSAATGTGGEWLEADFGEVKAVNAFQVNFAEQNVLTEGAINSLTGRLNEYVHKYLLEFSIDGVTWHTLVDARNATAQPKKAQDYTHQYFELAKTIGLRYIRITNTAPVPMNEAGGLFAISGLRFFGSGQSDAPDAVSDFTATRPVSDERSVQLSWDPVAGAEGYIIRLGIREDLMHNHFKVMGNTSATIRILNRGVDYYFSIDSYNDSGLTRGTVVKHTPFTLPAPRPVTFLRATVNNLHSDTIHANVFAPPEIGLFDGVFVESFETGSYLLALGLKRLDIITSLNGIKIDDAYTLIDLYDDVPDGDDITLRVWRRNRYMNVTFTKDPGNNNLAVPCTIGALSYSDLNGVRPGGDQNLGNTEAGGWAKYSSINFAKIPDYVIFRASRDGNPSVNARIEMRIGSLTADPVAVGYVEQTGSWSTYMDFRAEITGEIQPGVHDIYVRFPDGWLNFQSMTLGIEDEDIYPPYEIMRFGGIEGTHNQNRETNNRPAMIYADWQWNDSRSPVDITNIDPKKLYLRMNMKLETDDPLTGIDTNSLFGDGVLRIRSTDGQKANDPDGANNREHRYGWNINSSWNLRIGDNYIDIPLESALNNVIGSNGGVMYGQTHIRGIMDWAAVERMLIYINPSNASKDANITFRMTLSDVRIVDITFEEEREILKSMIENVIPRGIYTAESYNAYIEALEYARLEMEAADAIIELKEAEARLQAAIDALEEGGIPHAWGDVNNDGVVNIFDMIIIRDHIVGRTILSGTALEAAKVIGEKDVSIKDILAIRDYILGKR
ncbi:MAG: carbohydrate-binding protein [Oscillospiraceae bacterium]|nr:carbohydrate-binding protein [Oscillospiraceae bacterium]